MDFLKESCEKLSDEPQPDYMWATIERIWDFIRAEKQE
jgi:hypothetical protein